MIGSFEPAASPISTAPGTATASVQVTGEEMMGGIALQLDADRLPHLRAAAVGADDQPAGGAMALPVEPVLHRRLRAGRDPHIGHPAPHRRPGRRRLLDQQLAQRRMAEAQRPWNPRQQRRQIEAHQSRHLRRHAELRRQVPGEMMAARRNHCVVESQCLQLDHAPRRDPLAPHVVAIDGRLLQHEHRESRPRQVGRQRPATDAAANDHQVEPFVHRARFGRILARVNRRAAAPQPPDQCPSPPATGRVSRVPRPADHARAHPASINNAAGLDRQPNAPTRCLSSGELSD
jgi:hypothetical protein